MKFFIVSYRIAMLKLDRHWSENLKRQRIDVSTLRLAKAAQKKANMKSILRQVVEIAGVGTADV